MTRVLALLLALCLASPVLAQPPAPDVQIVELSRGAPAPFSGMLFPTETAVRWRLSIESLRDQLDLNVRRANEVADVKIHLLEERLQLDAQAAARREDTLRQELERARARAWYERPVFWYTVGVITTIIAAAGLGYAVNH